MAEAAVAAGAECPSSRCFSTLRTPITRLPAEALLPGFILTLAAAIVPAPAAADTPSAAAQAVPPSAAAVPPAADPPLAAVVPASAAVVPAAAVAPVEAAADADADSPNNNLPCKSTGGLIFIPQSENSCRQTQISPISHFAENPPVQKHGRVSLHQCLAFVHTPGRNISSIGKISSLPISITSESTTFTNGENAP